jgi:CRISPR-associated protein (TIGR02710 family)
MSKTKGLKGTILTIGLSSEPAVYSLQQINPDFAAFICTRESANTLDKVWEVISLPQSHVWQREIADAPDQIGRLVHEFYNAFLWLRDDCDVQPQQIQIDPTLGRKWMSAGVTMIASYLGLSMSYTDVRFKDNKPDPTTMRFIPLGNAYDQTGFLEAEKARELFNQFEFSAASEVFERLRPTLSASADLYAGLAQLARTLHRWELFEHYDRSLRDDFNRAFNHLDRSAYSGAVPHGFADFLAETRRLADAVDEVTGVLKPCLMATVDLLLNAERRVRQGRYDDATARSYRALESLSQLYLATRFQLATSNPDYSQLTQAQREAIVANGLSLSAKIALEEGWRLLWALRDDSAQEVLEQRKNGKLYNKFQGVLDDRNNSILAHGWNPVGAERARRMVGRLKDVLIKAEGESVRSLMARLEPPALPSFWGAG